MVRLLLPSHPVHAVFPGSFRTRGGTDRHRQLRSEPAGAATRTASSHALCDRRPGGAPRPAYRLMRAIRRIPLEQAAPIRHSAIMHCCCFFVMAGEDP